MQAIPLLAAAAPFKLPQTQLRTPFKPIEFYTGTLQIMSPVSSLRHISLLGPGTLLVDASGVSTFSGNITDIGPIAIQGNGSSGTVYFSRDQPLHSRNQYNWKRDPANFFREQYGFGDRYTWRFNNRWNAAASGGIFQFSDP